MRTDYWLRLFAWVTIGVASLNVTPVALAAQAQALPPAGAAVHELGRTRSGSMDARDWRLDPAVFTEITPFTAPDIAVGLPSDQVESLPEAAKPASEVNTPDTKPAPISD